ncbi:MAG: AAA family ATPase [Acidobacteriota bacterium]
MQMKPAIKSLRIQNLFSFGEMVSPIELGPLNILIGPNASGKSNFIGVIGLLKRIPRDFADAIAESGGISECLWKGLPTPTAVLEVVANPRRLRTPVRYQVSFTRKEKKFAIVSESLKSDGERKPRPLFEYKNGDSVLYRHNGETLVEDETDPQQSVLSRLQDSTNYPEITYLGRLFRGFRLYSDWEFGQTSNVRDSYQAEAKTDFLEEDISNLGLMLNRWLSDPAVRPDLLRDLKVFYEDAEDLHTPIQAGLVDIRLEEKKRISIPATRLSDGTLRWLALLTILLHPAPPPVVCLEEPELGLHPDAIRLLGELLIEASRRTQLIVTTHSDSLVDQFTEIPEAVLVFEKREGSTVLKRLNRKQLSSWLERYSLGHLWRTGEIGRNRF